MGETGTNVEPIRYLTLGGAMDAATMPGPQHMLALERANRVRLARAALKRKVFGMLLTPRYNRLLLTAPCQPGGLSAVA